MIIHLGIQVFIYGHWRKHFEEEIKDFWLRGREALSTRHSSLTCMCNTIRYGYSTDGAGVQLE